MRRTAMLLAAGSIFIAMDPSSPFAGEGRYTMQPAEGGGFVRLDSETGAVSFCNRDGGRWSCGAVADATSALTAEINRLKEENKTLKDDVRRLEDTLLSTEHNDRPEGRLQLPSEEDVDRALNYFEKLFRKFRDRLKDFDTRERRGTPL